MRFGLAAIPPGSLNDPSTAPRGAGRSRPGALYTNPQDGVPRTAPGALTMDRSVIRKKARRYRISERRVRREINRRIWPPRRPPGKAQRRRNTLGILRSCDASVPARGWHSAARRPEGERHAAWRDSFGGQNDRFILRRALSNTTVSGFGPSLAKGAESQARSEEGGCWWQATDERQSL